MDGSMGKAATFVGLIIVAVFIYLLVTNQSFVNYVSRALHTGNPISQLPISVGDISQLLNATSSMNQSQFLNWAQQGTGVINPVISKIRSITNSTTFKSALGIVWTEIEAFKSGSTISKITAAINQFINSTKG